MPQAAPAFQRRASPIASSQDRRINRSLRQRGGFQASHDFCRVRAPVVGRSIDYFCGRAATGQARCSQRPDGTVFGSQRHGLGPRRAHGGRGFWRQGAGPTNRSHFRRPPEQADIGANIARQWIETEGVTLILDVPNSAVGLAVREVTRTRDAVDINTGAATSDLTGKACSPHGVHWSFDTWRLGDDRPGVGQAGWR